MIKLVLNKVIKQKFNILLEECFDLKKRSAQHPVTAYRAVEIAIEQSEQKPLNL